jgi:hypothetical protein
MFPLGGRSFCAEASSLGTRRALSAPATAWVMSSCSANRTGERYKPSSVFKRARVACNVARGTAHSFLALRALESIVRS